MPPFSLLRRVLWVVSIFSLATEFAAAAEPPAAPPPPTTVSSPWPAITRDQKPWTRWWWLGSAVDKTNITRELETLAAAGIGGVEITPIYGAKGFEERFVSFLSPQYVELLAFTCSEARRLGLGVDMATGTGWPFGGKSVSRDDAELRIEINEGEFAPVSTKFKVKRAAPGGEGWVLNPFSPDAMTRYLEPFSAALEALPVGSLHGQFHDSFEYTANWSKEVLERFRSIHEYQLQDYIKLLSSESEPDTTARIKSDYRDTLAALHLDYIANWIAWTHAHGQIARNQAHGAPVNLLDLYAQADIPETEVFGASPFPIPGYRYEKAELSRNEPQPLVNRFASSAGHVGGRPIISSETFTWVRDHFHEAPSEMKPELDQLFLTGINHIFFHGTAYSPSDAPWPGWLFYASTQFNSRNPLWRDFASLNTYIARCESLLQSGQPDNDFLVYWPMYDVWHQADGWNRNFSMHGKEWLTDTATGKLARDLLSAGHSFDFISDNLLLRTNVLEHFLQAPGARYRALIVPPARFMPTATLERILSLARQGAVVLFVGDLPKDVPGFGNLEARRALFKSLLASLEWSASEGGGEQATVGRGKLFRSAELTTLLPHGGAQPEAAAAQGLGYLRRALGNAPLYFLANLSDKPFDGWLKLARPAKSVLLLDPRTGLFGQAAARPVEGGTEVYLQLKPGESLFVKGRPTVTSSTAVRADAPPAWTYWQEAGPAVPLDSGWSTTFLSGGPEIPPAIPSSGLHSWTAQGGPAESFAGTAAYQIEFKLPADASSENWLLDLGDVRETARVFLNGQELDHVWSLPFQTKLEPKLQAEGNTLRIEVTNLAANRIRDLDMRKVPWKNFYDANVVNAQYQKLDAAQWPLQPSGLLGPVRLVPLKKLQPLP